MESSVCTERARVVSQAFPVVEDVEKQLAAMVGITALTGMLCRHPDIEMQLPRTSL